MPSTNKSSLQEVSIDTAEKFNRISIVLIPGKKICPSCQKELVIKLQQLNEENQWITNKSDLETGNESDTEAVSLERHEMLSIELDVSLEEMDLSPIKLHGVSSHSKVALGKRKLGLFCEKIKDEETTLERKVAKVIDIMPEDLAPSSEARQPENYKEIKEKAINLGLWKKGFCQHRKKHTHAEKALAL